MSNSRTWDGTALLIVTTQVNDSETFGG